MQKPFPPLRRRYRNGKPVIIRRLPDGYELEFSAKSVSDGRWMVKATKHFVFSHAGKIQRFSVDTFHLVGDITRAKVGVVPRVHRARVEYIKERNGYLPVGRMEEILPMIAWFEEREGATRIPHWRKHAGRPMTLEVALFQIAEEYDERADNLVASHLIPA